MYLPPEFHTPFREPEHFAKVVLTNTAAVAIQTLKPSKKKKPEYEGTLSSASHFHEGKSSEFEAL